MANNADILGTAFFAALDQAQIDDDLKEQAEGALQAVLALIDKDYGLAVAIKSNADLSESGRQSQLAANVERSDKRLDAIAGGIVGQLEAQAARLSASLQNAADKPAGIDTALLIERRSIAYQLDPLEVQARVLQLAVDGTDDLSVLACLTAPLLQQPPLLGPKIIAEARALMAARLQPDLTEQLRQTGEVVAQLRFALQSARRAFGNAAERVVLGIDPVKIAAAGVAA